MPYYQIISTHESHPQCPSMGLVGYRGIISWIKDLKSSWKEENKENEYEKKKKEIKIKEKRKKGKKEKRKKGKKEKSPTNFLWNVYAHSPP